MQYHHSSVQEFYLIFWVILLLSICGSLILCLQFSDPESLVIYF